MQSKRFSRHRQIDKTENRMDYFMNFYPLKIPDIPKKSIINKIRSEYKYSLKSILFTIFQSLLYFAIDESEQLKRSTST